jgi:hypothetical protein
MIKPTKAKPISYQKRLAYFFTFIAFFVIGFPILVFYSAGYTLDETFGLSRRGGIYVFTPEPDTSVFVGNELKNTSGFFNKEVLVDGLKPDQYLVLAANELYWPWAKLVQVEKGEVEALMPLMVPKVVPALEIKKTDSDYKDVLELFSETATSTEFVRNVRLGIATSTQATTTQMLTRRNVRIWLDGGEFYGLWLGGANGAPKSFCTETVSADLKIKNCSSPIQIFHPSGSVRNFDFYPLRNDAIMLALDNGIYAVEIDRRTYQNFYPVYRGKNPDFRVDRDDVYIRDEGKIFVLDLNL